MLYQDLKMYNIIFKQTGGTVAQNKVYEYTSSSLYIYTSQ